MTTEHNQGPVANTFEFEELIKKTMHEAGYLTEFFRLNIIYYDLISGKGLEFEKIRRYQEGDDARRIDWKIFARTDKLYLRTYREERDINIVIVLDVSDSMLLGTNKYTKNEFGSLIGGILSHAAVEAGDRVSGGVFSSKGIGFVDPENDFIHLLHVMSDKKGHGGDKDWDGLTNNLINNYDENSIIFIISDFINSKPELILPDIANRFAKVYGIMVKDPVDYTLPKHIGKMYVKDPVSEKTYLTDMTKAREEYEVRAKVEMEHIKDVFHEYGQHCFMITTGEDFSKAFIKSMGGEEVEIF
ncbi:MAG: DUF58 domain-containing protein [Nanobdellota archaeon]